MIPFIPAVLVKLTVILVAGLIAVKVMHAASASVRHLVLLATLICGLTLPVAMVLSPRWDVPLVPESSVNALSISSPAPLSDLTGSVVSAASRSDGTVAIPVHTVSTHVAVGRWPDSYEIAASMIPLLWAAGCLSVIGWLVIGRLRLRRIARTAWPLNATDWANTLDEGRAEAGVRRVVRLCSSPVVSTPLTWGWLAPIILLPEDAPDWSDEHRRIVLRHELAHIARADSLTQIVAGFVCALYWFHPLVWVTERRLRAECERACDDRVVSLGTSPTEYASHLLEVARSARAFGAPGFLSVAMARPSQLEGRLLAVLSESRRRVGLSRVTRYVATIVSLFVLLPLAAFTPVGRPASAIGTSASMSSPPTTPTSTAIKPPDMVATSAPQKTEKSFTTQDADSSFTLSSPVRSDGTLELDLKTGGAVTITSWDKPAVEVSVALKGRNWRDTRVSLHPFDGGATLESNYAGSSENHSSSHRFVIQVPRTFNVRIRSAGGSVSIENVSGRFVGNIGGGEITIRNVNGDVDLETGGGEVHVSDSNINGNVGTGGGVVRIVRVNGTLKAHSGSGPVIYTDSQDPSHGGMGIGVGKGIGKSTSDFGYEKGAIRMDAAGGPLSLPSAPQGARVTTGGGRIRIGPSGGAVYAETGGGPIDIGPASGSVAAHTGSGDVSLQLIGAGPHDVDITSGTGRVVLVVPSDLNATLELESAYTENFGRKTRVVGDWPLSVTETAGWDDSHGTPRKYVRVRQNIGRGGGLIRVRTVNGDIELKRQ
jgi:beta-lactamase regulating signal transducer with metallopeptidase domain